MIKKITSTLTGAFLFIMLINIIGKGLGFFREILFANYFGMGTEFDLYLVGAVLPMTINTVILCIGQNFFIPSYNKIKAANQNRASEFSGKTISIFGIGSIILTLLLFLFSAPLLHAYLNRIDTETFNKTLTIFQIFLLSIPLNSLISILIAQQQAEYKFKYPAISRLLLNISIIPILIIFKDSFGIYTIPIGFVTGIFLQLLYLIFKTKIKIQIFDFDKYSELGDVINFTIIRVLLIETITQVYLIADRYFLNQVSPGGISALNYAVNVFILPISIISTAVGTIILPKFSHSIHLEKVKDLVENYRDSIRINLFIFVPVSFLFFVYGEDLIHLFFKHGKFTTQDSIVTFNVLKIYTLSLIFYSTYTINNKIIYGARLLNQLLIITVMGIVLKIIMNFLFVTRYDQYGLALSSSVSYIYFFLCSIFLIRFKIPALKHSLFFKELFIYLINGLICYVVVEFLFTFLSGLEFYEDILKFITFYIIFLINLLVIKYNSITLIKDRLLSIKLS